MENTKGITNEDFKAQMSDLQVQLFDLIDELMVAQGLGDQITEDTIKNEIRATRQAITNLIDIPSSIHFNQPIK
jgi:cob(I)alamin adenosyltransferase